MKTVCEPNMCTACTACIELCPKSAIRLSDRLKNVNALIDESRCINCGLCEKVCQVIHPPEMQEPIKWFQGWSRDQEHRRKSSSGGFAISLAGQFISEGGYVASCTYEGAEYIYTLTNKSSDIERFRGSKYVKSSPSGVYPGIKKLLKDGIKVLFIGLPCHVAGLKNYMGRNYDNLFTVDLICHGSPSPELLELFLKQYNTSLQDLDALHFRQKGNFRLIGIPSACKDPNRRPLTFTQPGIRDRYSIAFLYGLIYTENCYYCKYAGTRRCSDITLGDSWGSELDAENREKGISLALCQTVKGIELLKRSSVELHKVNIEKAVAANHQLREAFPQPKNRDEFFHQLSNEKNFNDAVKKCFPLACFRLDLKNTMLKHGILK